MIIGKRRARPKSHLKLFQLVANEQPLTDVGQTVVFSLSINVGSLVVGSRLVGLSIHPSACCMRQLATNTQMKTRETKHLSF